MEKRKQQFNMIYPNNLCRPLWVGMSNQNITKLSRRVRLNMIVFTFLFSLLSTARAYAVEIGGKWTMNANGHLAILLITAGGSSGTYEFINWYDCETGNMENLIVSRTTISWDRECADSSKNQHYEAELSDNLCEMINGIFTFRGREYYWSASRDGCEEIVLNNLGPPPCPLQ